MAKKTDQMIKSKKEGAGPELKKTTKWTRMTSINFYSFLVPLYDYIVITMMWPCSIIISLFNPLQNERGTGI